MENGGHRKPLTSARGAGHRKPLGSARGAGHRKPPGSNQDAGRIRPTPPSQVVCWGCNEFGQNSKTTKQDVAFKDGLITKFSNTLEGQVKVVACGASHTIIVTHSGEVYAWGNGNSGQLGTRNAESSCEPRQVVFKNRQVPQNGHPVPRVTDVACGGRHSMVVLDNGQVYSFGNNFYGQLGYDYRDETNKENQPRPYLLTSLINTRVAQVSCGDKHSIFRFETGSIACVGCNASGQCGTGDREEVLAPRDLDVSSPITRVACGSNHSLAITDQGEVYVWGYGRACGNKTTDELSPVLVDTGRSCITRVAGGMCHSMVLTVTGSVYSWGSGIDGQLGFGTKVLFLSEPQQLKHHHLRRKVVQISCGESFSAAVTENGHLYMWGKNSHTIRPEEVSGCQVWEPYCVNPRGHSVQSVTCGSWHAVGITGTPEPLKKDNLVHEQSSFCVESDDSEEFEELNTAVTPRACNIYQDLCTEVGDDVGVLLPSLRRDMTTTDRDKTKLSLAEFYAPTPDIQRDLMYEDDADLAADRADVPLSGRSTKLVVQVPMIVPKQDANMATRRDVATSPIQFSSSESEASAVQEYVSPAPTKVDSIPHDLSESQEAQEDREFRAKIQKTYNREESMPKIFLNYERQKTSGIKQPQPFVQLSKSSAGSFMLPRESTNITCKHIDFSEMEHLRSRGVGKSHENFFVHGKSATDSSGVRMYESPYTGRSYPENGPSRIQSIDNLYSPYSRGGDNHHHRIPENRTIDSPSLRSGRHSETTIINLSQYEKAASNHAMLWARASETSLANYARSWAAPESLDETRQSRVKFYVRPQQPTSSIPKKNNEANFGNYQISSYIRRRKLQISRSDTVVAPVKTVIKPASNRVKEMQRYANAHNPQGTSFKQDSRIRLGQSMERKVSIPASRAYLASDEPVEGLCVKGQPGSSKKMPMYSSATSWRDKTDMDKLKVTNGRLSSDNSPASAGTPESHREAEEVPEVERGEDDEEPTPRDVKPVDVLKENNNKLQYKPKDKLRRGKLVAARSPNYDDSDTVMLKIEPRGVSISSKDGGVSQVR